MTSQDTQPRVTLRVMTQEEFEAFLEGAKRDYVADMIRSGDMDEAAAIAKADHDMADVCDDGPRGDRHRTYVVERGDGIAIGALWLGARDGWARTWIYDIRVDGAFQGQGLGRATLDTAEQRAVELGATAIGLHVFAFNDVARRLYETSGYVVAEADSRELVMWKDLPR